MTHYEILEEIKLLANDGWHGEAIMDLVVEMHNRLNQETVEALIMFREQVAQRLEARCEELIDQADDAVRSLPNMVRGIEISDNYGPVTKDEI